MPEEQLWESAGGHGLKRDLGLDLDGPGYENCLSIFCHGEASESENPTVVYGFVKRVNWL